MLPQFREFWNLFQNKVLSKNPYIISIGDIKLKLHELQAKNKQAQKTRQNTWKAGITSTACCTNKASPTSRKLSGQSLLAGIMTIR